MGNVSIRWLGQMGLIISSESTSICIDYYAAQGDDRQVPPPIPVEELKGIDAFLGTHDHLDHIDHVSWKVWAVTNPEAKFIFSRKHEESVLSDGVSKSNAFGINAGDTVRYERMMPLIRSFGKIDIELLPINGRDAWRYQNNCIGNMTYQEAADLAGEVEPYVVIPGHWDMFADNSEDPYAFQDYIAVKYLGKLKCKIPVVM